MIGQTVRLDFILGDPLRSKLGGLELGRFRVERAKGFEAALNRRQFSKKPAKYCMISIIIDFFKNAKTKQHTFNAKNFCQVLSGHSESTLF